VHRHVAATQAWSWEGAGARCYPRSGHRRAPTGLRGRAQTLPQWISVPGGCQHLPLFPKAHAALRRFWEQWADERSGARPGQKPLWGWRRAPGGERRPWGTLCGPSAQKAGGRAGCCDHGRRRWGLAGQVWDGGLVERLGRCHPLGTALPTSLLPTCPRPPRTCSLLGTPGMALEALAGALAGWGPWPSPPPPNGGTFSSSSYMQSLCGCRGKGRSYPSILSPA